VVCVGRSQRRSAFCGVVVAFQYVPYHLPDRGVVEAVGSDPLLLLCVCNRHSAGCRASGSGGGTLGCRSLCWGTITRHIVL
jgi:hypothetical protein